MNEDSITKDVWWALLFGVLPATGAMIGGAYIGGWVLGEDRMPWAAFAVIAGVAAAFMLLWLAVDVVRRAEQERSIRRARRIAANLGLEWPE